MNISEWININEKQPAINEVVIYKGNLFGVKGRFMGSGFVELKDGSIDQFEEWKPLHIGFVTMNVQHPEKDIKIECKGKIINGEFLGEIKEKEITFGITISLTS